MSSKKILVHQCPHCHRVHDVNFQTVWSVKLTEKFTNEKDQEKKFTGKLVKDLNYE